MNDAMECKPWMNMHVFAGWDDEPFCKCREVRNRAYKRTWWQRLLRKPKR